MASAPPAAVPVEEPVAAPEAKAASYHLSCEVEVLEEKEEEAVLSVSPSRLSRAASSCCGRISIAQSPAVDVVALGLADGLVVVYNLRLAKALMWFRQREGAVTALSFRTDGKQSTLTLIRHAHDGPVTALDFLVGEPILLSAGGDNSLKMWIFDSPDHTARLLRSREGHSAPPTRVRFYGKRELGIVNVSHILTAGQDGTLRSFSVLHDRQSSEFSQGAGLRSQKAQDVAADMRLPVALDFDANQAKEREWANLISCHENKPYGYLWSVERKALTPTKLEASATVTCVCPSACGNFGVLGASDGSVTVYNVQSGMRRDCLEHAHDGPVRGVASDGLNSVLVSAGHDGLVHFWEFRSRKALGSFKMGASVSSLTMHRDSGLCAVVTDTLHIVVLDVTARKPVRRFEGHTSRISDVAFSPDGRWLVTASMDCSVRVFDMPSARLVDWFAFTDPVTSLAFSPQADFLATTHAGNLGVWLWANKSYFSDVYLRSSSSWDAPITMDAADVAEEEEEEEEEEEKDDDDMAPRFAPVSFRGQVTLSGLPKSRWRNLSMLDEIKERNKPLEAPKAPPSAPFFLPTTSGLQPELYVKTALEHMQEDEKEEKKNDSRILHLGGGHIDSELIRLLQQGGDEGVSAVTAFLKNLPPAAIDAEVRLLGVDFSTESRDLSLMLNYFQGALDSRADFEFVEAVLHAFINAHGEVLARHADLARRVERLTLTHKQVWTQVQEKYHATLCLVQMFTGSQQA